MRPRYKLKKRVLEFLRTKDYEIWDGIIDEHMALTEEYMTVTPLLRERIVNGCNARLMSCIKHGITARNAKYIALYHIKSQIDYYKGDPSIRYTAADTSYEQEYVDKEKFWEDFAVLANEILTPREYGRIVSIYRDGVTMRDVGESQGVSFQAVQQVVARAFRKLRKAYASGSDREDFEVLRTRSWSQVHRLCIL
jgi:hypothetical protein